MVGWVERRVLVKNTDARLMAAAPEAVPVLRQALSAFGNAAKAMSGRHGDPDTDLNAKTGADNGVDVRTLSVRLGRRLALDNITGRFDPGSLTAVVGPNGAGKTTLLNVVAGLVRPHRGSVICPARGRKRIAYLQQQAELDRDYPVTVGEIVGLGLWRQFGSFRTPTPELADRITEAVHAVGLADLINRRIGELSVGQLRRAFFARLLLMDAEVILLDEPFAAIDASTVEALLTLIARWHEQRRTVIAVVHDFEQARAHFPSTLILARTAIAWGATHSVMTDHNLTRAQSTI